MRGRSEDAQVAVMVGGNSLRGARHRPNHATGASSPPHPHTPEAEPRSLQAENPRGTVRTPQEAKPEYARQGGHIRGRSRHLRE